jgi:tripartite-type tricarboxylate transporter receptor subunit TctC
MTISRRTILKTAASLTVSTAPALICGSWAQDKFPSKPITLVIPWTAGGSSDGVMRAFAESLSHVLGVAVISENKPGAGGTLGATAMLNTRPDGYTLTQLPLGIYRLPHMQKMAFDPVKDLTHIVCLTGYTFGLVTTADAPYKTLKELVAYAKAHPGKVSYGHTGIGTTPHLAVEEFSMKAGIDMLDVPYKGSVEVLQAILGGHINVMSGVMDFVPHLKSGKLRLLATLGRERTKGFLDVPTIKENGWDTISESPIGIGGPKNMDPTVVKILHDAFKKTLDDPKIQETLDKFYQPTIYMNTADYSAYAVRTFAAEKKTIERLGMLAK